MRSGLHSGLLSVGGGKLSAYRSMAERIVDTVIENHGFTVKPCTTADVPLPGGDAVVLASDLKGVGDIQAERLARLYGAEALSFAGSVAEERLVKAEVQQAVQKEGALRLEDYWARRSSRAWFDEEAGLPILNQAAMAMADLLGWNDTRKAMEIENCRDIDRASRAGFQSSTILQGVGDDCRAAELIGAEQVSSDANVLAAHRFDRWCLKHWQDWQGAATDAPACVVRPRDSADVQTIVRFAAEHNVPCPGVWGVVFVVVSSRSTIRF